MDNRSYCVDETGRETATAAQEFDEVLHQSFDPKPIFAEALRKANQFELTKWAPNGAKLNHKATVDTYSEIARHGKFCGQYSCADQLYGHQCMMPRGPVTLVARALLLRLGRRAGT